MAEKYDVKVLKLVYGCMDEETPPEIWLFRHLQLPFPPFIGLYLKEGDTFGEKIDNVTWELGAEMFRVFVESDDECLFAHQNGKPHRDVSVILEEYTDKGWLIEEEADEEVGEE